MIVTVQDFFNQSVSLLVTLFSLIYLNVFLGFTFVCLSVPRHIENNSLVDVEFHFYFGFGWEGHELVSGSLLLFWGFGGN